MFAVLEDQRMRPYYLISFVALVSTLSGCKETSHSHDAGDAEGGDVVDAGQSSKPEFYAADIAALQKNADFFFRVWDEGFTRRLDDLPKAGAVPEAKTPMSGGYYAESFGGTNVVVDGNRTPLQKYDAAFNGGANKAAAWEQSKHSSTTAWAGHCNGFSAAAIRNPTEPKETVTKNGVTFGPKDIKALMAEIHMNVDYEFLGGNRCEDPRNAIVGPAGREDIEVMGDCEDINPGTLHAAVTNWIGRMKHALIIDMYAGDEIWNFPLYKYAVSRQDTITESQARQYVTGNVGGKYVYNPSAVKFVYVEMRLTYIQAHKNETLNKRDLVNLDLSYVLELNGAGDIVGGEWTPASLREHPDFLWVALELLTPNGTRYMGNPHLDNDQVLKLWAESVNVDPDNIPTDITRPAVLDDWGKWPGFEVSFDGNSRGAVFAGKKSHLHIKRREILAGDVTLELGVNGSALKTFTLEEDKDLNFAFEPGIGLNRFQFTWKRDGATVDEQFLRFHVLR